MDIHRLFSFHASSSLRSIAFRLLSPILGLFMTGATLTAEEVYTTPRGIYTVKVAGSSEPTVPARTYVGIQLLPDRRYQGPVFQTSGNRLSLRDNVDFTALADGDRKYHVHVLSGAGRGYIADILEFTNSEIVCTEDLTNWVRPGDVIRIRAHPRLSDLLGIENRFGLGSGMDADSADNVVIWDPDTQQERVYYFHSLRKRWEEKDIETDAGNTLFKFPYGFYIVRRSPGTIRIALTGEIGSDAVLLPVRSAANVFSLPLNLSASLDQIIPAEGPFTVISGPNAKSADILTFEEPATGTQRGPFYHHSNPETSVWREIGVDGSTSSIQPLDFLSALILRREGAPGHVLVEGSLEPPLIPRPVLPADPEPDEIPMTLDLPIVGLNIPSTLPPGITMTIETSTDLHSWETAAPVAPENGVVKFQLPAGQSRSFYRLKVAFSY